MTRRQSFHIFGRLTACVISCVLTMVFGVCASVGAGDPVASVVIEAEGNGGIVTFAHPFAKGDVNGSVLVCVGGKELPAQVDIKRHYGDGSVKHAIISTYLSGMTTVDIYSGGAMNRRNLMFATI